MDGKEIGKVMNDCYREIYGQGNPTNVFAGGNPGLVALALAIENLVKELKAARESSIELLKPFRDSL